MSRRSFKKLAEKHWQALRDEIKMLLHASRDCLRNKYNSDPIHNRDPRTFAFNAGDGYYGEAFGIIRALSVLGYGDYHGAVNTPEERINLQWWFDQIQKEVLKEENYPGMGGNDSHECDWCLVHYGKDSAGRERPESMDLSDREGAYQALKSLREARAKDFADRGDVTDDFKAFGDRWVYCGQHLRPHKTGWCTVGVRDKIVLRALNEKDAILECREKSYKLFADEEEKRRIDAQVEAELEKAKKRLAGAL